MDCMDVRSLGVGIEENMKIKRTIENVLSSI